MPPKTRSFFISAASLLALHTSGAQGTQSTIREVLKTGAEWVNGVAEPLSGRFIVFCDDNAIRIYNRQTQKTTSVPVSARNALGGSISLSASGGRVIFPVDDDTKRSSYIWAMDLDTLTGAPASEPHRVSPTPGIMASISRDGRWIAMSSTYAGSQNSGAGNRLLVIPANGGDERMLDSAVRILTPRWSADGKTIFYVRGRGKGPGLTRIAAAGGTADSLLPADMLIGVSPDGKQVAYAVSPRASQVSVGIADLQGNVVDRFQFNGDDARPYGWTSRGRLLAFRRLEPSTLKTISLSDGKITGYPVTEPYSNVPRFSPDGSKLAVIGKIGGRDQFVVFDVKTKQRRVIADAVEPDRIGWRWSPDASHIAFLATNLSTFQHELHAVEVATARDTRLAAFPVVRISNATRYRWRADGKAIDFIPLPFLYTKAQLHRVTLGGAESVVRDLPLVPQGDGTDPGYRLVSDDLVITSHKDTLLAVPVPAGEPRNISSIGAWWGTFDNRDLRSPDGKWIAVAAGAATAPYKMGWGVVSLDGKTSRVLGATMGCDSWPVQWFPDSHALLGVGAPSCEDWHEELYVVPIDDGPARRVTLPSSQGYTLMPEGRSLLIAMDDPKLGSIVDMASAKMAGSARP